MPAILPAWSPDDKRWGRGSWYNSSVLPRTDGSIRLGHGLVVGAAGGGVVGGSVFERHRPPGGTDDLRFERQGACALSGAGVVHCQRGRIVVVENGADRVLGLPEARDMNAGDGVDGHSEVIKGGVALDHRVRMFRVRQGGDIGRARVRGRHAPLQGERLVVLVYRVRYDHDLDVGGAFPLGDRQRGGHDGLVVPPRERVVDGPRADGFEGDFHVLVGGRVEPDHELERSAIVRVVALKDGFSAGPCLGPGGNRNHLGGLAQEAHCRKPTEQRCNRAVGFALQTHAESANPAGRARNLRLKAL